MGKPKKNIKLIKPNCSAVSPNSVANWGRMPARILKEKAVVMRAKQLALNSLDWLIVEFIAAERVK